MRREGVRQLDGVTLIELLVVVGIFGVLLSVIAIFFSNQVRSAGIQKASDEANEAARVAMSLVTWDIQNAGFEVPVSNSDPAFHVPDSNANGHLDGVTIRYFNDNLFTPEAQRIRYRVEGSPGTLTRAQYADDPDASPTQAPTVAEVVAVNIKFETRANQFVDPDSDGCPPETSAFPDDDDPERCEVHWIWQDVPERLVRRVRLELLARSERHIPRYTTAKDVYEFTDDLEAATTTAYEPEPGYAYKYAEQTISTPNLGR